MQKIRYSPRVVDHIFAQHEGGLDPSHEPQFVDRLKRVVDHSYEGGRPFSFLARREGVVVHLLQMVDQTPKSAECVGGLFHGYSPCRDAAQPPVCRVLADPTDATVPPQSLHVLGGNVMRCRPCSQMQTERDAATATHSPVP